MVGTACRLLGLVAASLLVACRYTTVDQSGATPATVCQILMAASNFAGRQVRLTAVFQGQMIESQYLVDESCIALGRIAIAREDDRHADVAHMNVLAAAIEQARVASNTKMPSTVEATLVGTIRRNQAGQAGIELVLIDALAITVVERQPVVWPLTPRSATTR